MRPSVDVNACLSLQNAYVSRRCAILEQQQSKAAAAVAKEKSKQVHGGLLRKKRTQEFLNKIDQTCEQALLSACTDFQIYSCPVVECPSMTSLIEEAGEVFGLSLAPIASAA